MDFELFDAALETAVDVLDAGGGFAELHAQLVVLVGDSGFIKDPEDEDGVEWMACALGRAILNAMPNPSKGFAIDRQPALGRNDRCVIGRDCKHKQCCGAAGDLPAFESDLCWAALCRRLPAERMPELMASKRLPPGLLALVAARQSETDPERAVAMLTPYFDGKIDHRNPHLGELMLTLCDVYDDMGRQDDKMALLERVAQETRGQPRADALQRMATIYSDRNDYPRAWTFFANAKKEAPDDPALSHLEITMLMDEGRQAEVKDCAIRWVKHFERLGDDEDTLPLMGLLRQFARGDDPQKVLGSLVSASMTPEETRLFAAIDKAMERPVQPGRITLDSSDAARAEIGANADGANADGGDEDSDALDTEEMEKSLVTRLTGMGIKRAEAVAQAKAAVADLQKRLEEDRQKKLRGEPVDGELDVDDEDPDEEEDEDEGPPSRVLVSEPALAKLEADWHRAWPGGKPFSTHPFVELDEEALEGERAAMWIEFLERYPEALDSLDVLDDLNMMLQAMRIPEIDWAVDAARSKIFARTEAVLAPLIEGHPNLAWGYMDNRPALRLLVSAAFREFDRRGNPMPHFMRMLKLNPNDNHGIRDYAVNGLLQEGRNAEALAICEQFDGDISPALALGRVLAMYRLDRMDEAKSCLDERIRWVHNATRWLVVANKQAPKERSPYGIQMGGDEQAWEYRADMRDTWAATPGALAWLAEHTANYKPAAAKKGRR